MTSTRWRLAGAVGLALLILAGCKQEEKPAPAPGPGAGTNSPPPGFGPMGQMPLQETEPHAAGKKVFNAHGCIRCHSVEGAQAGPNMPKDAPPFKGGPPMGGPKGGPKGGRNKGPDLGKVAAKEGRDVEWFIAFVGNPKKDNPNSRMPPFEKQIKSEDMRSLAEFLASLK